MSNIGGVIKSIRNIFRKNPCLSRDSQHIEQPGWMLFLKIFSGKDNDFIKKLYKLVKFYTFGYYTIWYNTD